MRTFFTFIILSVLITVMPSFAQNTNRVVAFVNEDLITLHELNNKLLSVTGLTDEKLRLEAGEDYFKLREEILDMIIDEKLIKAKLQELGMTVTNDEVDQYIEFRKKAMEVTHEDLVKQLESEGVTYESFYEKMKTDLERTNLIDAEITRKLIITEEDLLDYYRNHRQDYEKEGKVHIASIFLVSGGAGSDIEKLREKGIEILEKLKKGEQFEALAREYSRGPGAEDGGDLGIIPVSQIDPQIYNIIKEMEDGDVSELINRGSSIQIIKLIERREKEMIPFKEVRDGIYETVYNEEIEKRYNVWVEELREGYYIKKIL